MAGLAPAVKATKVPPIAAVREGATLPRGRLAPFLPFIAIVLVALAVALLGYGMFTNTLATAVRLISLALGCLVLFIGVALLSPRLVPSSHAIVRPIAKWVMLGVELLVYPTRLGAWLFKRGLYTPRHLGARSGPAPFSAVCSCCWSSGRGCSSRRPGRCAT